MKAKTAKLQKLGDRLDHLIEEARSEENAQAEALAVVHPNFARSARNLVHYSALRRHDLRDLQKQLGNLGMSRLAKAHAHVMASLLTSRAILKSMLGEGPVHLPEVEVSVKRSAKLLRSNTKSLLGRRSRGRRVRIMVTLPSEAADDAEMVFDLVAAGMNSARINCAHDDADAWIRMIQHVRQASEKLRRSVKVCMDLGGPKIRTGSMQPGPKVVSFAPERDTLGKIRAPGLVWLGPDDREPPPGADVVLPATREWVQSLEVGDRILFTDARDKPRSLTVTGSERDGFWLHAFERSYLATGARLYRNRWDGEEGFVGDLDPLEGRIILKVGDRLRIHASSEPGEPAVFDEQGNVVEPAHLSCTNSDVFDAVETGQRVLFDDGKIEGEIVTVENGTSFDVEITYTKSGGQKLRADKGINFPDTSLFISGLTNKDREDLAFVVEHADVVNMSFVNTPSDVQDLIDELKRLGGEDEPGIILKIETRRGFENLTDILLTAMQVHPVGLMIARGDLAVECGWEDMPVVQEEILIHCQAGHIPDVWATQVLENLAKKGIPSRAEVTDAATALQAECVMLNKGPHIVRAIVMLDRILKKMKAYRHDKAPMLPPFGAREAVVRFEQ